MDFSITNISKARKLLQGTFDVNNLQNGDAKELKLSEEAVIKIINGDKDNAFELLNKAGNLLKTSWLTRITGHKKNDFSSLQGTSDLCVENFYRNLKDSVETQKKEHIGLESINPKAREAILCGAKLRIKEIFEDLGKLLRDMKADPEIGRSVRKHFEDDDRSTQIKMIKDVMKNLQGQGIMSKNIKFTDVENRSKGRFKTWQLGGSLAGFGGMVGGAQLIGNSLGLGLATVVTVASMTTSGIMLGVGLGFAVLLSVPAVVLYLKRDSVGAIANKRERIAFQGRYVKIIKKLNDLDKYIETEILKTLKQTPAETKINPRAKEIVETINTFLENQAQIWKNYITAEAREYNEKDKHWSLGKKVSNEKTSSMGKLKQGLANQWLKISLAPDMLNPAK